MEWPRDILIHIYRMVHRMERELAAAITMQRFTRGFQPRMNFINIDWDHMARIVINYRSGGLGMMKLYGRQIVEATSFRQHMKRRRLLSYAEDEGWARWKEFMSSMAEPWNEPDSDDET